VRAPSRPGFFGPAALPDRVADVLASKRRFGQAELVAVVKERRSAQGEERHERAAHLPRIAVAPSRREPHVVVVRCRPHRPSLWRDERLCRFDHLAELLRSERRVHEREVEGEMELIVRPVVRRHHLEIEDVRLADQEPRRLVAVGDRPPAPKDVVHLGAVHAVDAALAEAAELGWVVVAERKVVAELAVLDDRVRDVDPEAGDAPVEPEPEDVVERLAHLLVPPVQVGLRREEVVEVVLLGAVVERPRRAAEDAQPVIRRRPVRSSIRPDIPVAMARRPGGTRVEEPWMPVTRVVRDDVEEDADPTRLGFADQRVDVVKIAEDGLDGLVVGDVVPPVLVGRDGDGVEPDAVDAEPLEVIKARDDPRQVSDAVSVRIHPRAGVDLVEDAVAPPRPLSRHERCILDGRVHGVRLPAH